MNATARRVAVPLIGTAVVTVTLAGVATGYYRSVIAPTGTGSAGAANVTAPTFTVTGTVSTGLYPGGPGATMTVTVANPNTRPIAVQSLASAGTVTVSGASGTCTTTGLSVASAPTGLPATVGAGSTVTLTLTGAVTMGLTADSGCQGASFTIPLKVTGQL
ncbi:MAG TPA: hypothetical protein VFQ85_11245 [Mycobacteriales bacterium]|jgi:hypothetical protein|nr:hypothetical protein [Mycobacteriales bacterium]